MTKPVDFLKQASPGRSIADVLAEVFRKRIVEGEYLPGMRLVETDITKLYGVSRGPVREAFRRLIAEGYLEAEKHRSPVVRGVGRDQFYQMFEVRSVLEGLAARLLAGQMSNPAKKAWVEQQIGLWSPPYMKDPAIFVEANTRLHDGTRDLTDHAVLVEQIKRIAIPGFKGVFRPAVTPNDIRQSSDQHLRILKAILAGDAAAAERAMIDHVMNSAERVVAHFSDELFDRRLRELEKLKSDLKP